MIALSKTCCMFCPWHFLDYHQGQAGMQQICRLLPTWLAGPATDLACSWTGTPQPVEEEPDCHLWQGHFQRSGKHHSAWKGVPLTVYISGWELQGTRQQLRLISLNCRLTVGSPQFHASPLQHRPACRGTFSLHIYTQASRFIVKVRIHMWMLVADVYFLTVLLWIWEVSSSLLGHFPSHALA